MKAYKGFDKDLKCRDFQYEVGKTYETDEAKLCESGFHACEAPLNVFNYYPPTTSRYCAVDLDEVSDERGNDSKVVGKKITVGAEIGIPGLVKAHVEYTREKAERGEKGGSRSNLAGGEGSNLAGGYGSNLAGGDWSLIVGRNGAKAKGGIHSVIVLTEWEWQNCEFVPVAVKSAIVDGKQVKPDTWYTLKGGKFVKAEE